MLVVDLVVTNILYLYAMFPRRSIHYDLKEPDVVALFSTFGTVTKSEMSIDPMTQRSKGFCFIEYADQACAEAAMAMDGFEIAGRKIKVGKPFHGQGAPQATQGMQIPGLSIPGLGIPGLGIPGLGIPGYGYPAAAPPLPVGLPPVPTTMQVHTTFLYEASV